MGNDAKNNERTNRPRGHRPTITILVLCLAILGAGGFLLHYISTHESGSRAASARAATLTLKEAETPLTLTLGEEYQDPGYTATSARGEDLTKSVEVEVPEMPHTGDYQVT